MTKFYLFVMCTMIGFSGWAGPKHCSKGKPCGNACISKNDVCHKDQTSAVSEPTSAPQAMSSETPSANKIEKTVKAKNCKKGKACGDTCIPKEAECHR